MTTNLYLSLIPEALIASMLTPEEFGLYYAIGNAKRSRGQAVFFSVDRARLPEGAFDLSEVDTRCVPHPDGGPKRSLYIAIYRVLERIPREAITALHLATDDGRVLTLSPTEYEPQTDSWSHLYQEFCPVSPRVVSSLDPAAFTAFITDDTQPVHVPRIVFAELTLGALAQDPVNGRADDLPYPNVGHLRDCLVELADDAGKSTKTVLRQMTQEVLFRTVSGGFHVGDATGLTTFALPSRDALEREHFAWWRSAQSTFGQ
ncbi:hypothetical protein RN607_07695 [Demequina capsici]|uniref:Uncharacterized protein n=1 Tax=Demequina capsici TaxID=3075620 RepID=A0AA96J9J6_9MICO|nr:hypothetical protein [Demequina sp. PMTSA13]WNM26083.1 hypothetical protein RN607_07695 [Demequina sp. PMTSA13]